MPPLYTIDKATGLRSANRVGVFDAGCVDTGEGQSGTISHHGKLWQFSKVTD